MTPDLRAHLDRLDAALAAAHLGPLRAGEHYDIHLYAGQNPVGTCHRGRDAALIVAAVNALPGLLAAVRAAADLADELDEDSRAAMRISADGRERGDREVHRINARHGRVSHHAATALRTALAAALTEGDPA